MRSGGEPLRLTTSHAFLVSLRGLSPDSHSLLSRVIPSGMRTCWDFSPPQKISLGLVSYFLLPCIRKLLPSVVYIRCFQSLSLLPPDCRGGAFQLPVPSESALVK